MKNREKPKILFCFGVGKMYQTTAELWLLLLLQLLLSPSLLLQQPPQYSTVLHLVCLSSARYAHTASVVAVQLIFRIRPSYCTRFVSVTHRSLDGNADTVTQHSSDSYHHLKKVTKVKIIIRYSIQCCLHKSDL